MQLSAQDLFSTPNLFLFAFEQSDAIFLQMDREAYYRSIFLDARIQPLRPQRVRAPADGLAQWRDRNQPASARLNWIFHVANCGSTLLARALDRLRSSLVLREPLALRQLGVDHARVPAHNRAAWDGRLRLVHTQLAKRYRENQSIVVKANVPVNFILPQLLAQDTGAAAICLYYPLNDYVLALLRSPDHRAWVMRVSDEMKPALTASVGELSSDPAERVAALWLAQMRSFADLLTANPNARSLDAGTFFGRPRDSLAVAAELFGIAMSPFELDAAVASQLFSTYAKDPSRTFTEQYRRARSVALATQLAPEIKTARRWIEARQQDLPVVPRLPAPLIGAAPPLL